MMLFTRKLSVYILSLSLLGLALANQVQPKKAVPKKGDKEFVLTQVSHTQREKNPTSDVNSKLQKWRTGDIEEDKKARSISSDGQNRNLALDKKMLPLESETTWKQQRIQEELKALRKKEKEW